MPVPRKIFVRTEDKGTNRKSSLEENAISHINIDDSGLNCVGCGRGR